MNKIFSKILLAVYKFIPKLHLKPPATNSDCEPFTKHRERIQKLRETSYLKHLCKNELGKACINV